MGRLKSLRRRRQLGEDGEDQDEPVPLRRKRLRATKWARRGDDGLREVVSDEEGRQEAASASQGRGADKEAQGADPEEEGEGSDTEESDGGDADREMPGVELMEVASDEEAELNEELDGCGDEEWEMDEQEFREALLHEARESGTYLLSPDLARVPPLIQSMMLLCFRASHFQAINFPRRTSTFC
jgi:hypothetical protein